MKINIFLGDLSDIAAETKPLSATLKSINDDHKKMMFTESNPPNNILSKFENKITGRDNS